MVHLEKVICTFIIVLATLRLSFQDECRESNSLYHHDKGRLCTPKYTNTCIGTWYTKALSCENIEAEELPENRYNYDYMEIRESDFENITNATLASFSSLKYLKIHHSNVSHIDQAAFDNYFKLKFLALNNNNLKAVEPVFDGLFHLQVLVLSQNLIESVEKNSLVKLIELEELYLSDNKIVDMSPLVETCNDLVTLDLSNNLIEKLQLGTCTKLEYLKIPNNRLKTFTKKMFENVSLIHFDISNNKIDYIEGDFFENFTDLKLLNLSRNPFFKVNDMPIDFFQNSRLLETLDLSSTFIKNLDAGTFSPISNVRVLHLSWNNLTHLPMIFIDTLRNLNRLYLNGNNLSYIHIDRHFKPDQVDLRDNNWQCDVLGNIVRNTGYYSVILGNDYNVTNIRGIGCRDGNSADNTDAYASDREYLLKLQEDQDDIIDALIDLNGFLSDSNLNQSAYLEEDLEDWEGALIVRDIILNCILFVGIGSFAIFAYCYYRRSKS